MCILCVCLFFCCKLDKILVYFLFVKHTRRTTIREKKTNYESPQKKREIYRKRSQLFEMATNMFWYDCIGKNVWIHLEKYPRFVCWKSTKRQSLPYVSVRVYVFLFSCLLPLACCVYCFMSKNCSSKFSVGFRILQQQHQH